MSETKQATMLTVTVALAIIIYCTWYGYNSDKAFNQWLHTSKNKYAQVYTSKGNNSEN